MATLEISDFTVQRGKLRVVDNASLVVTSGPIVGLLGLNGAGKSSLLASVAGNLPSRGGRVTLDGVDLTQRPPWERCGHGVVLVPSGRQLFAGLSVLDNLLVGGHILKSRQDRGAHVDRVFELFPVLRTKARLAAGRLSGGQQQMLAIGRGLMADPKILMLDEPSEGLAPLVVEQVFDTVRKLRDDGGLGILLAEQNVGVIDVIDSIVMMQAGLITESRPVREGDATTVAQYVFGR